VESVDALRTLQRDRTAMKKAYPNLVEFEARLLFRDFFEAAPLPAAGTPITDVEVSTGLLGRVRRREFRRGFARSDAAAAERRRRLRIGIPKALNIWSTAPFWRTYLQVAGLDRSQIVFSDDTSEEMWIEGGKYGSVDPCYPAKVAQAHIHQLLFHAHSAARPLTHIVFPCITHLPTPLRGLMDTAACPIVAGTPEVMKAAFTKEVDFFARAGVTYLDPAMTMHEPNLLKRQLFEAFGDVLGLTRDESDFAADQAWAAMAELDRVMEEKGREILEQVEAEGRLALLLLGRPYHLDPGLNHDIVDEFQVLGYPILSMRSLPKDESWLRRFFEADLAAARVTDVLGVQDVWPENYSANSALKVWAARFASRHPNIAVLDLSSFKCGHDAPIYGIIDDIVRTSGMPYSALHDIDANKPSGSINIRVKTYAYSLERHGERLSDVAVRTLELHARVEEKRVALLELKQQELRELGVPSEAVRDELLAARARMQAYTERLAFRRHATPELPDDVTFVPADALRRRPAPSEPADRAPDADEAVA
jgi:predicted nucleotide-binding protein (sugar kinase/HSP70/actin superfamily)